MAVEENREGDNFNISDTFVAPWGLANETRPMHILWNGDPDTIQVGFASCIEVIEVHNIRASFEEYVNSDLVDGDVTALEIPIGELEVGGYLSVEFKVTKTFEEVMVGHKIAVVFLSGSNRIDKWEDYTFTIRPKIKCLDAPNSVSLSEDDTIDIVMQYVGFGMAEVKITAEAEGEIISEQESIYHDILDKLIETEIHKQKNEKFEEDLEEWEEKDNFEEEEYEEFVTEFREMLQRGDEFEDYDDEQLQDIADILKEDDEERDTLGVYKAIELLLINSFIDMVDRHPAENIQLESAKTTIDLSSEIKSTEITYRLRDVESNEYEHTKISIDVDDGPEDTIDFETEINTEWENIKLDPDEERDNALERMEEEL